MHNYIIIGLKLIKPEISIKNFQRRTFDRTAVCGRYADNRRLATKLTRKSRMFV